MANERRKEDGAPECGTTHFAAMHGRMAPDGTLEAVHNGQRHGCPLCPEYEATVALVVTHVDHERKTVTLEAAP